MIPVFVISLKDSYNRRKHIEKHLKELGLNFEWFDAINGSKLAPAEIKDLVDEAKLKKDPFFLSPGAIGCQLSHYYLYKEIIKRNLQYALILEDDIIMEKNFVPCIDKLAASLNTNEIIAIYYQSKKPLKIISSTKKQIDKNYSTYTPLDYVQPISTGAYMISRGACESLVKIILPVHWTADSWRDYHNEGGFESLRCIYPRPVDATDATSTLQYKNQDWKFNLKKFIDRYKIFPVYHILLQRRKKLRQKMMVIEMVP